MKNYKSSETITFVTREDGQRFMIARKGYFYEVWISGSYTGYKFRSMKKAIEHCEYNY